MQVLLNHSQSDGMQNKLRTNNIMFIFNNQVKMTSMQAELQSRNFESFSSFCYYYTTYW